jgi:hypothetical protein
MKKILLAMILSTSAQAVELKFIGPCQEEFIMKTEVKDEFDNVGELTIATLTKFGIPFQGSPEGLASAFQTPTGKEALEIVSKDEIRAYGWCYSVDGVSPEVYPHEAFISSDTRSVVWHFGFARSYKGQWVTQCTPAYTIRPAFLCKDDTAE